MEILADGTMRTRRGSGEIDTYDTSWNPRHPARPEFYPLDFQFPLQSGAEWSFASGPGRYFQQGSHKIVAYEPVTVPAGTFDCYRLEGESIYTEKYYSETWRMVRWYCPAVKYVAKMHVERTVRQIPLGSYSVLDSELIRFRPGR